MPSSAKSETFPDVLGDRAWQRNGGDLPSGRHSSAAPCVGPIAVPASRLATDIPQLVIRAARPIWRTPSRSTEAMVEYSFSVHRRPRICHPVKFVLGSHGQVQGTAVSRSLLAIMTRSSTSGEALRILLDVVHQTCVSAMARTRSPVRIQVRLFERPLPQADFERQLLRPSFPPVHCVPRVCVCVCVVCWRR